MKLFQQLLVAPAALGLFAPIVANASDLNLEGVSDYSGASEQVTSASQFSDVYPTDWTYQAISNLAERYGCLAGSNVNSNKAITRFEAASMLNACLDRVSEMTDEVRRLVSEFGPELAVLQGSVDGLEARVGEFEAGQFSTTTKLKGKADFTIGATGYDIDGQKSEGSKTDGTTMNYTYQLALNTSFTGSDLLYTRLKTGNYSTSAFGGKDAYVNPAYLTNANSNEDTLKVDKIWYQFPFADGFTAYVGPKIENYYMLESTPSVYKPQLKAFKLGGNYSTYGASTGAGFGVSWRQSVDDVMTPRIGVSTGYTAEDGKNGSPASGGMFTADADSIWLSQVSYGNPQWQVAFAFAHKGDEATSGFGTYKADDGVSDCTTGSCESTMNSYAIRAYWQPEETGVIPSFSVGYDISKHNLPSDAADGTREATNAWFAGMMWKDAFIDGNTLGFAISGLQWVTEFKGGGDPPSNDSFDGENNTAFELYYDYKVSDNITVTPTVFYLGNPFGSALGKAKYSNGDAVGGLDADNFSVWGGVLKTTFKF